MTGYERPDEGVPTGPMSAPVSLDERRVEISPAMLLREPSWRRRPRARVSELGTLQARLAHRLVYVRVVAGLWPVWALVWVLLRMFWSGWFLASLLCVLAIFLRKVLLLHRHVLAAAPALPEPASIWGDPDTSVWGDSSSPVYRTDRDRCEPPQPPPELPPPEQPPPEQPPPEPEQPPPEPEQLRPEPEPKAQLGSSVSPTPPSSASAHSTRGHIQIAATTRLNAEESKPEVSRVDMGAHTSQADGSAPEVKPKQPLDAASGTGTRARQTKLEQIVQRFDCDVDEYDKDAGEDAAKVAKIFQHFDADGDKHLNCPEYLAFARKVGAEDVSENFFDEVCKEAGATGGKGLTMRDFAKIYADPMLPTDLNKDYKLVFSGLQPAPQAALPLVHPVCTEPEPEREVPPDPEHCALKMDPDPVSADLQTSSSSEDDDPVAFLLARSTSATVRKAAEPQHTGNGTVAGSLHGATSADHLPAGFSLLTDKHGESYAAEHVTGLSGGLRQQQQQQQQQQRTEALSTAEVAGVRHELGDATAEAKLVAGAKASKQQAAAAAAKQRRLEKRARARQNQEEQEASVVAAAGSRGSPAIEEAVPPATVGASSITPKGL